MLSVVVPVYNVENYLNKCVGSLLQQTHPIDEIILVDDGSTDRSGMISDEFAEKYAKIKVIHKKNGGLADARNAGIDVASGDYIAFVDSDDYIEPRMYEALLAQMDDTHADMIKGGVWYEQESGERYTPYPPDISFQWNQEEALIQLNSYRYFNMSFCDAVFRRSLFEEDGSGRGPLRFPVGKLCEDQYLMYKVIARTGTVAYTSVPYYHYIQRNNSISRNTHINLAPMDASMSQLAFFRTHYPQLTYVAETACAFSYMGIYTAHIRQRVACPKPLLKELKQVSTQYLSSVLRNGYIPPIKKLQALAFCYALPLYRLVISKTEHR